MQKAVLVGALLLSTPVFADIPSVIAATVRREIGEQWVIPALKIAKIESGYNCKATGPATRHGRAKGVFQVMDGSARALGFSPRRMHDCNEGIRAGVAHMKLCIRHGVRTGVEMAACHLSGVGGWRYNRNMTYKRKYLLA